MTSPAGWVEAVVGVHAFSAYLLAAFFPLCRWARRAHKGQETRLESVLHQAATGFVVPAFVMLCLSYGSPVLLTHLSPHEVGLAGLFALVTSLRELAVDGIDRRAQLFEDSARL